MQGPPQPTPMGSVPIIGQQPSRKQMMEQSVAQAMSQLSFTIYSNLSVGLIATRDVHQDLDMEKLRQLARDSQVAARAYFEGLGVIEEE